MTLELRPYQIDGLAAVWNYYQQGNKGNALVCWPTGVGKTILPAVFIQHVLKTWPSQRFILATHVSDLISQNAEALLDIWPNAPLGIHSAGLGKRETALPIIYAGIQSAIKHPEKFGFRDIAFVDEAHLISQNDNSMYQTFFAALKLINPQLKIIGLTATPFRVGQGLITDGGLFTDIVHDLTEMNAFNKLIDDGYLAPLIPHKTDTILDISEVGVANGEFIKGQLQKAVNKKEITDAALTEAMGPGQNRKSWMIFATGIEHAEHIAETMNEKFGIDCAAVHSQKPDEYNKAAIKAFKDGSLRSVVNVVKLTTGINVPALDFIIDLQPTMSPIRHVQKLGRGTRPCEGKNNCVVLDFGRNVPRLGPINYPVIPRKKGDKLGDAPIKLCEHCGAYNYAGARFCCDCGAEFIFQTKLVAQPGTAPLIKRLDDPIIETFPVDYVIYARQENKMGKPPYIRATYFSGMQAFKQNVFPQHGGMSRKIFRDWWRQRSKEEPPLTTDDALRFVSTLRKPKTIRVHLNLKYPEILQVTY